MGRTIVWDLRIEPLLRRDLVPARWTLGTSREGFIEHMSFVIEDRLAETAKALAAMIALIGAIRADVFAIRGPNFDLPIPDGRRGNTLDFVPFATEHGNDARRLAFAGMLIGMAGAPVGKSIFFHTFDCSRKRG